MESRAIYLTLRVDLSVPDNYELSNGEIAEELECAQVEIQLPQDCPYLVDNVEVCGGNINNQII